MKKNEGLRKVPLKEKEVFTTGEVAKVCNINQQTVIRIIDKGILKGYRIPGSRHRRICRDKLIKFMKENKIPMNELGEKND